MFFKRFDFGESSVYFVETPVEGHDKKTTVVGMAVYPKDAAPEPEKLHCDSLVQVAFAGDESLVDYTRGVTMRNRSSTLLKVTRQVQFISGNVNTYLSDGKGNEYVHKLGYDRDTGVFSVSVRYENRSRETRLLEHLSTFSLSGIGTRKGTTCGMELVRMTSAWSRECRLRRDPFSRLGLDMSWARYGVKTEKWGECGSMPNRGYYPFGAVGDGETYWAVQLEAPYSWQMEVYEEKETCAFSGGLGDYETAHWRKEIKQDEAFETHKAYFTVKHSLTAAMNALVREQDSRLSVPPSEESMPVLFNEYCTTWGNPTPAKIARILKAIKTLPIDCFVIDCGWYKPNDKGWCNAVGDWIPNADMFPEGIKKVAETIKAAGKKPGIWFEFEIAGRDSALFSREELLLKRDGAVITAKNRRFLDLRLPETERYLTERMLDFLRENGFEYVKIDYNDAYGIGCDSPDGAAPGEGGRRVAEESLYWLKRLRDAGIVIENCSSGGSRIEPLRMSMVSTCSFSDAHECVEIPLVAANVSRVVPARQSQIWAVIRKDEPDSRTIYSLCAAMMGRICLSGDIWKVSAEKIALIGRGLAFYNDAKDVVRRGEIRVVDCDVEYYREPKGRQVYVKDYGARRLVIVHFLDAAGNLRIPLEGYRIKESFTDLACEVSEDGFTLSGEPFRAGAFLLEKEEK